MLHELFTSKVGVQAFRSAVDRYNDTFSDSKKVRIKSVLPVEVAGDFCYCVSFVAKSSQLLFLGMYWGSKFCFIK